MKKPNWFDLNTEHIFPSNPFYYISDAKVQFVEHKGGGHFPEDISSPPMNVQTDQKLEMMFKWTQKGLIASWDKVPFDFFMEVYLEGWGAARDLEYKEKVDFKKGDPLTYEDSVEFNLKPGDLAPGTYKVIAVLKLALEGATGNELVAAFEEICTINVYEPAF